MHGSCSKFVHLFVVSSRQRLKKRQRCKTFYTIILLCLHIFYGPEAYIMGKVYKLFVRKGVLKNSPDNEIILTGSSRKKRRTLGGLISSQYAKEEILSDYYELLKDVFIRLNIRNCIMHGLGESFDYLDRGITAIMFQLLWDISGGEIFKTQV